MAIGSYRKGLALNLGVIQTTVDLTSVIPSSDRRKATRLCPKHHVKLKQAHLCPDGNHHVEPILGYDDGDKWRIADSNKPEVPAVDGMELIPVPADQLREHTFDGAAAYWVAPSKETSLQGWEVLRRVLSKGKVAFVCKGALRRGSAEKLWRLGTFQDHLVLREIVFPDKIRKHPDVPNIPVKREVMALVNQFVSNLTDDWKDIDTTDHTAEQVEQWIAKLPSVPKPTAPSSSGGVHEATDLMAALKQAVEATKKSKPKQKAKK